MDRLPKQSIDDVLIEYYRLESVIKSNLDEHQKKYVIIRLVTIVEQFFRCVVEIKFRNVPSTIPEKMELDTRIIDEAVGGLSIAVRKEIKNKMISLTYSFQGTDAIKSEMDKFNIRVFGCEVKEKDVKKLFKLRHIFVHSVESQQLQFEEIRRYYTIIEKLMKKVLDQMKNMSFSFYAVKGVAFSKLGNLSVADECFKIALDDFKSAIESTPNNPDLHLGLALAEMDLGNYSKAVESYTNAIERGANNWMAYLGKGDALYKLGQMDNAIIFFDKAIYVEPNSAYTYYIKGKAQYNLGKAEIALACFDRAIESKPDSILLHFEKWVVLKELGMSIWADTCLERAKECVRIALTENPSDAHTHYIVGLHLLKFEQHNEARACFEKTLELYPNHVSARDRLDEMRKSKLERSH